MEVITVKDIPNRIDAIIESYNKGSDNVYKVVNDEGEYLSMIAPFDGPWTETIKEDSEGESYINLPERIINKYNLKEGDSLEMDVKDNCIVIKLTK